MVKISLPKSEWYTIRRYNPTAYDAQNINKIRNYIKIIPIIALVILTVIFLLNAMLFNKVADQVTNSNDMPVDNRELLKSVVKRSERNNITSVKNNTTPKGYNNNINNSSMTKQDRMDADDIPYFLFTIDRLYLVDSGKEKNVVEKPIGLRNKDIQEVIKQGVKELNKLRQPQNLSLFTNQNFVEGIYKTIPREGSIYELQFSDQNNGFKANEYHRITLKRPMAPLQVVETARTPAPKQLIHLILPVKGRIPTLKQFLKHFIKVCVRQDRNVYLTIVNYGLEDLYRINSIVQYVKYTYNFKMIDFVTLNEPFSRGKAFQVGATRGPKTDALMFLCDIDMMFSQKFLDRCRRNTERGKSVYFPVVFNQYNPNRVYPLLGMKVPRVKRRLVINKMTGAWRDYGYGMVCQYKSDFEKVKAFDGKYDEWGGEDLDLYQKYKKSAYRIVRAIDPSIIHIWHEKKCNPKLPNDQYRNCVRSAAKNEASRIQLGLSVLGKKIDKKRSYREKLVYSYSDGLMIRDQLG
ncbi:unnamed protein product [Owenia fusiformis]|uniref:Hexosyltransferase n=1 Tax=Owenia fusiformis TaxID=6347 RepID=A0A8J1TBA6_OWEFU|nr:unnamed protein product [Owenia fusiformis]